MLDVDGQVISAADLVARVEQLLGSIRLTRDPGDRGSVRSSPGPETSTQARQGRLSTLAELRARMQPPLLTRGAGLGRQAAWLVKRLIRKLILWYVEPRFELQRDYDANVMDLLCEVDQELSSLHADRRRLDLELAAIRRLNVAARLALVSSLERAGELRRRLEQLAASSATMGEVQSLRRDVSAVLDRLGAASVAGADIDYVAFEDRFRGSTDQLRQAQARYLTLFPPAGVAGAILDVGCGRGEMLELLREAGHDVLGVDLDDGMVRVCIDKGLPVVRGDAIHTLGQMDDGSLKGIFCAQVVEHLLTSELEQFVRLACDKLRPEGVLVMETINPRSSFALGDHFFADTSHVRPVHPETLRFICEQVGFSLVQLEERSPHPMLEAVGELPANKVGEVVEALVRSVFGYQDYAIAATR
ncbi:MAG: hypothetical protein DLM54_07435 [Acidimicrobiales bacterium]|nr:MAG: hypothetical protein DLM54_07435 [Acidimicrobiales bacterium]